MPLDLRRKTHSPFPIATGILEFLSIFKRSQASSPIEAFNSTFLWGCQRAVKPPVEMRQGTRDFLGSQQRIDIPSCCERTHALACESLQGNQALLRVRGTRCPFLLRQQI